VSHRGGGVHQIAAPTGEGNRTVFLTSPARASALEQGLLLDDEVDGIALCSDGMAEAVLAAGGQGRYVVPPAFEGYFRAFAARESDPSELTRRLLSPDFAATSGDDKSMVMVVKG
jgi:hypothetical protein